MAQPHPRPLAGLFAGVLVGALASLVLAAIVGGLIVWTGAFDVTAIDPHGPVTAWAVHGVMIRAEQIRAKAAIAPARFSTSQVLAGARAYGADCSSCHGGPGQARRRWVSGMTPTPPYLVDAARHWTAPELFSIVGNGVKMTGMPAWRASRSDAQIWDLVAFLEVLPDLPPRDYALMTAAPDTSSTPPRLQSYR